MERRLEENFFQVLEIYSLGEFHRKGILDTLPLWTQRIYKGLNVIYSHKPKCDSHLHPDHFTLFSPMQRGCREASIIFTPTLYPFYTAKSVLCVTKNSSPREFSERRSFLQIVLDPLTGSVTAI